MATTYDLPYISTRPVYSEGDLWQFDHNDFSAGVTTPDGTETLYKHIDGSPATPTLVRSGVYPPNKAGTTNRSLKLTTTGVKTNGDGVETPFQYSWTIAEADGSNGNLSDEQRIQMLLTALAVLTHVQWLGTSFRASTNAIHRQLFGESDILHLTHNSWYTVD